MSPALPALPKEGRSRLLLSFLTVVALHVLLLLVPSAQNVVPPEVERISLTIRLVGEREQSEPDLEAPAAAAANDRRAAETAPPAGITQQATEKQSLAAELQPADDSARDSVTDREAATALVTRIVSSPYLDGGPSSFDPFPEASDPKPNRVQFQFADRSAPDPLIYPEAVALPFADGPLYAVEFYDNGVLGGMQRFRDSVTWSKTWTTKNGTRIGCALVLIIPACAWD